MIATRSYSISVGATLLGLCLALAGPASAAPLLSYPLPAAWDGVAAAVTDQSGAGNDAVLSGVPALSATVPPGAPGGTMSLDSTLGGFRTNATQLLENSVVAAAGGFQYTVSFLWDGSDSNFAAQKIIDYAGTESLQVENWDVSAGTADLRFLFNDNAEGPIVPIVANTWYDVVATFVATDVVQGDGSLPGEASLVVDGGAAVTVALSKTNFGDGLGRAIGIGTLPIGSGIVNLSGLIYDPAVSLLPEPSAALLMLGLCGGFVLRRR